MKCKILHESKGRIRVHLCLKRMSLREAEAVKALLLKDGIADEAKVYDRTCDCVIKYSGERETVIKALSRLALSEDAVMSVPENTGEAIGREYQEKLVLQIAAHFARKLFLPVPLMQLYIFIKSLKFICSGLDCLRRGKLHVEVLDALSISVSMIRKDFSTAGSVMFLLGVGELLEEWTHKKSVDDLAKSMALNVDRVWIETADGEVLVPVDGIKTGDLIHVRSGGLIPLDGVIERGEVSINQASLTGEGVPVTKDAGSMVYAGTVVEEGEFYYKPTALSGEGRYDRVVKMIEESEQLKSEIEGKAAHLADTLVPYSLGGTVLAYLLTQNADRALSLLMVDFSCALKLSMPLAVLSAMREAGREHITVKGGRFMEAIAEADTIVFDKTGTLTRACPTVIEVEAFNGNDRNEMLRTAACLEEHYPHSIANAVTRRATELGLHHEEMHEELDYVVAHGISGKIGDTKVVIGSYHFVFEDEGCSVPEGEKEKFDSLPAQYSHLYLAMGGVLSAVILISDPLRDEAKSVIEALHGLGIKRCVMMTGDSGRTAKAIAEEVGVDEYHAEVLPEDKAEYIRRSKAEGHKVIMIGDGINDSPALSEADCGIAISDGAAIAREIADVTIAADDLTELVKLRRLSALLMKRINSNYRFVMGFNGALIALGFFGILQPATSALMHNASTIAISLKSMTDLE